MTTVLTASEYRSQPKKRGNKFGAVPTVVDGSRNGVIVLPWPNRDLHPNARVHWARKASAVAKARAAAGWEVKTAKLKLGAVGAVKATIVFYPPNRRAHDLDGLLASMKAAIDGIADAIGVDDSRWTFVPMKGDVRKGGAVEVTIEATP